jgi:hypothetical protein
MGPYRLWQEDTGNKSQVADLFPLIQPKSLARIMGKKYQEQQQES